MKTTIKKAKLPNNDFWAKVYDKISKHELKEEKEARKIITEELEKILNGKKMIIKGSLLPL